MTQTKLDNYRDMIDSREIIKRITDLEGLAEDDGADGLDEEERGELVALRALAEEASSCSEDWEYGVTLVRDSYFVEHAQEIAEDTGAIPPDQSWPLYCIDWERAARELKHDYAEVDFGGVSYWVR